jgi:hypothetical protein
VPRTASTRTCSCSSNFDGRSDQVEVAVVCQPPEPRSLRPGRARGHPNDVLRSPRAFEPCSERFADERQPLLGPVGGGAVPDAERAQDEAELGCGEPRDRRFVVVERATGAEQLQGPKHRSVRLHRDQQSIGGARPARGSLDGGREIVAKSCLPGQLGQGEPGSRELGRERLGPTRGRTHPQAALRVDDPNGHGVRARHREGRVGHRLQGILEPMLARGIQPRSRERVEGVVGDLVHSLRKSIPHLPGRPAVAFMLSGMAQPARRPELVDEALELDPAAVQRAYQLHRARRRVHRNRRRETKRAKLRFWIVLLVLVAASVYLSLVIWHQIQRTFGL